MGLLKTGMKAVVAVKTADVIHERIQRRQQEQSTAYGHQGGMAAPAAPPRPGAPVAAPPAQAAPQAAGPAAAATGSVLAQLTQLGELRASGVLTDAEFETQKARILAG